MSTYLFPIKMAVIFFPFIALVLSLPFMILQYRRYGSFIFWRAVVLYSFVFYLLAAYFMVILPLPSVASVAKLTTQEYNLVPFTALRYFLKTTVFSVTDPATWLPALKQPGFIQPAFNVILTLPFGVYLRYYFKRPLWQIVLCGFGLSLFFELTQLSGLYGIYPRPYRLFDVDDLIINTTGALIGGWLAPFLMAAFPSRDEMDSKSYARGSRVSWFRRFAAFLMDFVIVSGVLGALWQLLMRLLGLSTLSQTAQLNTIVPLFITFVLIPFFNHGATVGKALVRIKIVKTSGAPAGFWRLLFRAALLYGLAMQSLTGFLWVFVQLFSKFHRTDSNWLWFGLLSVVMLFLVVNFVWTSFTRDKRYFYDVWANTKEISTLPTPSQAGTQAAAPTAKTH